MLSELERIDVAVDRWCRRTASVERIGPFLLFVEPPPFGAKYARPVAGEVVAQADAEAVVARQRALGVPAEIEAVAELHPGLAGALEGWGWEVTRAPLLIHRPMAAPASPDPRALEVTLRPVGHDHPDLAVIDAIGHVAFSAPGMAVGLQGPAEAAARAASHDPASNRERLRLGHMAMLAAFDPGGAPVAYGSLLFADAPTDDPPAPARDVPTAEIVAVGTVPSHRRRGIGAALTAALTAEAYRRGVATVWLSAADQNVAALYQRLGFEPIGTYLTASAP